MASEHLSTDALASEAPAPFSIPEEAAPRGLSHIGDHIPFIMLMATLPAMPRWQLARIANRAIECLDLTSPDPDLEEDDPAGGNVEDEGEREEGLHGDYGTDQRIAAVGHGYQPWDIDREGFAGGAR